MMIPTHTDDIPLALWLNYWRLKSRYHRYEVHGLHNLELPGSALIVGYHGRPLAYDQCFLTVKIHDHFGYMPHGIVHTSAFELPGFRWLVTGVGLITGHGKGMEHALNQGEHIMVQPGGTREGSRSSRVRYKVDWGKRTGYLKLAIKHKLPIIPSACSGVDDTYLGLNNGLKLSKKINAPFHFPVWFGVGPFGLWPLSWPFPVKFNQLIGEPIHLPEVDLDDKQALLALSYDVQAKVQSLLDKARAME